MKTFCLHHTDRPERKIKLEEVFEDPFTYNINSHLKQLN